MKAFLCLAALTVFCSFGAVAQCPDEQVPDNSEILATRKFEFSRPVEASATIVASSFRTAWDLKGSEAPAVSIFLDGKYNQDLLFFSGTKDILSDTKSFHYEVFLGTVDKGEHTIIVVLNRKRSASRIGNVAITDIQLGATSL